MLYKNVTFYNEAFEKETADVLVEGSKITAIGVIDGDGRDMSDYIMLPGFIDIHIHGGAGGDFCDATEESLDKMSAYLCKYGITSFCGTTMTLDEKKLSKIMECAKNYKGREAGAKLLGINMEGPYIAMSKKGAQNGEYVREGNVQEFTRLNNKSGKMIKLITIAPESFDSKDFIERVSKMCHVSIGHTAATEDDAKKSFNNGITHATHLYNAMTPQLHRSAGVVGAVIDNDNIMCELICDGAHVCKTVIRNTFKAVGDDRICVISDSMRAAGLGDGEFEFGGQKVYVDKNGKYAHLDDGTIAASISNIFDEFKNLLSFGIDFKAALKACTINPAKAIDADNEIGSIAPNKAADFLFVDKDMNIKEVYVNGTLA